MPAAKSAVLSSALPPASPVALASSSSHGRLSHHPLARGDSVRGAPFEGLAAGGGRGARGARVAATGEGAGFCLRAL